MCATVSVCPIRSAWEIISSLGTLREVSLDENPSNQAGGEMTKERRRLRGMSPSIHEK